MGGNCGFTISRQQWQTCGGNYAQTALATVDYIGVHNSSVTIQFGGSAYTWPSNSGAIPVGTSVYGFD